MIDSEDLRIVKHQSQDSLKENTLVQNPSLPVVKSIEILASRHSRSPERPLEKENNEVVYML